MTKQQSLDEYFEGELHHDSPKNFEIPRINDDLKDYQYLITSRGDGNCLVRSIIAYMYCARNFGTFLNTLAHIYELDGREVYYSTLINDKGANVVEFMTKHEQYFANFYNMTKSVVTKHWSLKGCSEYHMDANAMDGLCIEIILNIFNISKLKIYQAFDGAARKAGWREIKSSKYVSDSLENIEVSIFTFNGCHYAALVTN